MANELPKPKVTKNDDDTWNAQCTIDRCAGNDPPFITERHTSRKDAMARMDEHLAEHRKAAKDAA